MSRPVVALAAAAGVALAGCASDRVTLLPNEDGHPTGAVAVLDQRHGRDLVVDQPLTSARLGARPGAPDRVKRLKKSYDELLTSLPPGAVSFVLNFQPGTTVMTDGSRPTLDLIRQAIASRPGAEVQVTGHTDSVGAVEVNDRLSQQRAEAIVQVLIGEGFPPDLLTAVGRGERELLVPTPDEFSNEANRRVEVIVR